METKVTAGSWVADVHAGPGRTIYITLVLVIILLAAQLISSWSDFHKQKKLEQNRRAPCSTCRRCHHDTAGANIDRAANAEERAVLAERHVVQLEERMTAATEQLALAENSAREANLRHSAAVRRANSSSKHVARLQLELQQLTSASASAPRPVPNPSPVEIDDVNEHADGAHQTNDAPAEGSQHGGSSSMPEPKNIDSAHSKKPSTFEESVMDLHRWDEDTVKKPTEGKMEFRAKGFFSRKRRDRSTCEAQPVRLPDQK
ncbi:uncharacterized protein N7498_009228 [Penicillium cinerascens]|uniref:Uncharacterized protein n=1 Tax=Penicillium cinerascens TaxID=70096 RepID=A0A9W9J422_9EURO|nr:uncharacterized protein N7498_009228 [Penicillium cinerascens]KAJ5190243.1 hypothetical protein N7498_009228 [Penicillium cinerascens]